MRLISDAVHQKTITLDRCLREQLALIPDKKLLITNDFSRFAKTENILSETLEVDLSKKDELTTLLDLLTKRLEKVDLVSVMQELQRTSLPHGSGFALNLSQSFRPSCPRVRVRENLSCVPRLQKTEQFL